MLSRLGTGVSGVTGARSEIPGGPGPAPSESHDDRLSSARGTSISDQLGLGLLPDLVLVDPGRARLAQGHAHRGCRTGQPHSGSITSMCSSTTSTEVLGLMGEAVDEGNRSKLSPRDRVLLAVSRHCRARTSRTCCRGSAKRDPPGERMHPRTRLRRVRRAPVQARASGTLPPAHLRGRRQPKRLAALRQRC